MASFNELPPILTGQSQKDMASIRDYLVRMAKSITQVQAAATTAATAAATAALAAAGGSKGSGDGQSYAAQLRALIIKTADTVMQYTDAQVNGLNTNIQEGYVAKSEYGTFVEGIDTRIATTAKGTIESYNYGSLIQSAQNTADNATQLIQEYSRSVDGEIRRGLVTDPDTGEYVLGIAIAQNLQFTGTVQTGSDGFEYYELKSGQTFGLYTSTGWQFWIDGYKKGWYNSQDGMLHIANVLVENTFQLGDSVQFVVSSSGLFGIKSLRKT